MQKRHLSAMVLTAMLLASSGVASALQCGGRIVSIGDRAWEVKESCGEPAHIEETTEVTSKLVYDVLRHMYVSIPITVPKSVWVYNFGPTRLIYILTFRAHKLVNIETGSYGR